MNGRCAWSTERPGSGIFSKEYRYSFSFFLHYTTTKYRDSAERHVPLQFTLLANKKFALAPRGYGVNSG